MKKFYKTASRELGQFTVTRIVEECFPLRSSSEGIASVGSLIDEQLARLAAEGANIQTVTLEMDPDQWAEIATAIYGGYVEESR